MALLDKLWGRGEATTTDWYPPVRPAPSGPTRPCERCGAAIPDVTGQCIGDWPDFILYCRACLPAVRWSKSRLCKQPYRTPQERPKL